MTTQASYEVRTFESDDPPGFSDGFSVGADILRGLWVAITVTVGFLLLPVLVLGPVLWLLWMAWRRVVKPRMASRRKTPPPPAGGDGLNPPPPPPNSGPSMAAQTAGEAAAAEGDS